MVLFSRLRGLYKACNRRYLPLSIPDCPIVGASAGAEHVSPSYTPARHQGGNKVNFVRLGGGKAFNLPKSG